MNNEDLVSIITPSYNCSKFIGETINSIISQTYINWELLITDDCSTDNSCEIIEAYANKDPRIKLIRLTINSGAGVARNTSIEAAQGHYIAFCDSDDLWLPHKLEKQIKFIKENNLFVTYASALTCDETGKINGINLSFPSVSFKNECKCDWISMSSLIYDASKLGKVFLPIIRKRQDWGLKIKLLQNVGSTIGLYEPLSIYRIRKNSISRKKSDLIKYNIAIYRNILNLNTFNSYCKFFFHFIPFFLFKRIRKKLITIKL
ncbi:MAG: glycosyltransferase family 2 protein [Muribaculaceae bacterium]|nr:glycosyltransferase family 2 protein [Muribaculaceae bacterium]